MFGPKGEVGAKVGPLWKADVLKGFWGTKEASGLKVEVYRED